MSRSRAAAVFWGFLTILCLTFAPFAHSRENEDSGERNSGLYVTNRPANLYSRPSADAKIVRTLRPKTIVNVVEVTDQWLRVHPSKEGNPDGYIRRSYADPYRGRGQRRTFRPATYRMTSPAIVRAEPSMDSRKIATLREGAEVRVVERSGTWYKIEPEGGGRPGGYIPGIAAQRVRDLDPER
jgi:uncharacterized protein YgiM (DUF1202 family)